MKMLFVMNRYMIFNPETGEIFTRTPMSWLKITAFYVVYYSLLAAFWLICLQIFFFSLPEGKPKYDFGRDLVCECDSVGCYFGRD
jgi:sodium/potassium-transporting ATPase subunit beta